MVVFPTWVKQTPKSDKQTLASRRLRYLVMRAAVEKTESGSISSFADLCSIERTQIHLAFRTGHFSAKMALVIEKAAGRDLLRKEWLIFPLDIEAD